MVVEEFAPAKVNLSLKVTGKRADGYHLLDTCVVFTEIGDTLRLSVNGDGGGHDVLTVLGQFGLSIPSSADNLVVQAVELARGFYEKAGFECPPVQIELTKNIPVGAGLGGGSADAAAALRAVQKLWASESDVEQSLPKLPSEEVVKLGADVPMCCTGRPLRALGIGDEISLLDGISPIYILLVNCGAHVPTGQVFKQLHSVDGGDANSEPPSCEAFGLALPGNDLMYPACELFPEITTCLDTLSLVKDCRYFGMSGSGATCFALFEDGNAMDEAIHTLRRHHGHWWVEPTRTIASIGKEQHV